MVEDKLKGYRGILRKLLNKVGAEIGDEIELRYDNKHIRGILLPRSELEDEWHIVLKLSNGYKFPTSSKKDCIISVMRLYNFISSDINFKYISENAEFNVVIKTTTYNVQESLEMSHPWRLHIGSLLNMLSPLNI